MFFKSKLKTWLVLIIISLVISVLPRVVRTIIEKKQAQREAAETYTEWMIDIQHGNAALKNRLSGQILSVNGGNVKLVTGSDNADIVISDKEEELDGYTELKDYLYIPYIMVVNPNLSSNQDCFNRTSDKKEKYTKDIRYILSAIENEQKWKDIGLDQENVAKGNVSLMIPDEYSEAYPMIREYFIWTLNNYKEPDGNERQELAKRADAILEKCIKVENLASEFDKNSWFKGVILCPESIIAERPKSFKNSCPVIAPTKTIRDTYNVYVKAEKTDDAKEILKSYMFLEVSGYRNRDYNDISNSSSYSYSFDTFDFIKIGDVEAYEIPDISEVGKKTEANDIETEEETKEVTETEEETKEETMEETEESIEEATEESAESDEESDTVPVILIGLLIVLLVIAAVSGILYASI